MNLNLIRSCLGLVLYISRGTLKVWEAPRFPEKTDAQAYRRRDDGIIVATRSSSSPWVVQPPIALEWGQDYANGSC